MKKKTIHVKENILNNYCSYIDRRFAVTPQLQYYKIHFNSYSQISLFILHYIPYKINGLIFIKQNPKNITSLLTHFEQLITIRNIKSKLLNLLYECFTSVATSLSCFNPTVPCSNHDKNLFHPLTYQSLQPLHACVLIWQFLLSFILSNLDSNSSVSLLPCRAMNLYRKLQMLTYHAAMSTL